VVHQRRAGSAHFRGTMQVTGYGRQPLPEVSELGIEEQAIVGGTPTYKCSKRRRINSYRYVASENTTHVLTSLEGHTVAYPLHALLFGNRFVVKRYRSVPDPGMSGPPLVGPTPLALFPDRIMQYTPTSTGSCSNILQSTGITSL
jgi:hypothetical protein